MRYGMVIDTKRCYGCMVCSVSCKSANGLPDNIWWNRVETVGGDSEDTPSGVYPNNAMSYTPISCQHCVVPACAAVCSTGATYRDEELGIVLIDTELCIGDGLCVTACPYGIRSLIDVEPTYYTGFKTGYFDAPDHIPATSSKCTFCQNKLRKKEKPACMHLCPGRARHYGDLDDPNSAVSKLLASRENYRLKESEGTEPSVYYLT